MDYTGLAQQISAVHKFPDRYFFKIIGESRLLGEQVIRDAVLLVLPNADFTLTSRASSSDRWQAWTLEVLVPDVETVIALYTGMQSLPGLKALM